MSNWSGWSASILKSLIFDRSGNCSVTIWNSFIERGGSIKTQDKWDKFQVRKPNNTLEKFRNSNNTQIFELLQLKIANYLIRFFSFLLFVLCMWLSNRTSRSDVVIRLANLPLFRDFTQTFSLWLCEVIEFCLFILHITTTDI